MAAVFIAAGLFLAARILLRALARSHRTDDALDSGWEKIAQAGDIHLPRGAGFDFHSTRNGM